MKHRHIGQPPPNGMAARECRVVLVSMPFAPLFRPSIGLGLLQAALAAHEIPTKALYFTFRFAGMIGVPLYEKIAAGHPETLALTGEWIFSASLFGPEGSDDEGYVSRVLRPALGGGEGAAAEDSLGTAKDFVGGVLGARELAGVFLDECVSQIVRRRPSIVGFTSVFQQQLASLSLAKRIKAELPDTFVVFGGANCEGVMGAEVVRQFPFVDAVVSGEGDVAFPELVREVLGRKRAPVIRGVYTRDNLPPPELDRHPPNAASVAVMDDLPYPCYEDFFEQLAASRIGGEGEVRLLFETSRGCWWGEKKHCTFCGLNKETMKFRSKSGARALDELLALNRQHPRLPIDFVDNILDMKYFRDLIPEVAGRLDTELFYEVKANLTKEQLRLLRAANVRRIQPGVESLSTSVLALMRKGVTQLQNVQLLKWCVELGVTPLWNLIWGFPGEAPAEYQRMAELVPLITHLTPPETASSLRLDRFSPNFDFAEEFGFSDVEPCPTYGYIYRLPPSAVQNLAYYFSYGYADGRDVEDYTAGLREQVTRWQAAHADSALFSKDMGTFMLIFDVRPSARESLTVLPGPQKTLYEICDAVHAERALPGLLSRRTGETVSAEEVRGWVEGLVERGLMLKDGDDCLSLAIPLGEYVPPSSAVRRFR